MYLFGSGKYLMNIYAVLPTYKRLNVSLVLEYKFVKAGQFNYLNTFLLGFLPIILVTLLHLSFSSSYHCCAFEPFLFMFSVRSLSLAASASFVFCFPHRYGCNPTVIKLLLWDVGNYALKKTLLDSFQWMKC